MLSLEIHASLLIIFVIQELETAPSLHSHVAVKNLQVVLEVASRKFVPTKSRVQESNELELHVGM